MDFCLTPSLSSSYFKLEHCLRRKQLYQLVNGRDFPGGRQKLLQACYPAVSTVSVPRVHSRFINQLSSLVCLRREPIICKLLSSILNVILSVIQFLGRFFKKLPLRAVDRVQWVTIGLFRNRRGISESIGSSVRKILDTYGGLEHSSFISSLLKTTSSISPRRLLTSTYCL